MGDNSSFKGPLWESDYHRLHEFELQDGDLPLHVVHPRYARYATLKQDAQTGGF